MALRFLLVSLAIGLGVDLPSGEEVSSWARAGSDWVRSRLDDVLGAEVAAETKPPADLDFAAIVDEMAATFSADLAEAERPRPLPHAATTAEAIEVPEDVEPGIAYALNRGSQGEGLAPEVVPTEVVKAPTPEPGPIASDRVSRMASAVRLTRQAASAWWTVIRGAGANADAR